MKPDTNQEEAQRELKNRKISRSKYGKALIEAIEDDDRELVELLITAGANVNTADQYGRTPLITAAWLGKDELVQRLLEVPGIDVNSTNKDGDNAFHMAISGESPECARLLLETPGFDIARTCTEGHTPLHLSHHGSANSSAKLRMSTSGMTWAELRSTKRGGRGGTPLFYKRTQED